MRAAWDAERSGRRAGTTQIPPGERFRSSLWDKCPNAEVLVEMLVNIDVDDLERGIAFYCDAFGLRVGRRFGGAAIELVGGSSLVYLLAKPEGSSPTAFSSDLRRYARHWSPVHLDFVVADVDAAVQKAVAAGATLEQPVEDAKWGRIAMLADPFGHGFCVLQFVGRGYDEIAQQ
jgi:predicted enzyme related to lactoylglutathione lyase